MSPPAASLVRVSKSEPSTSMMAAILRNYASKMGWAMECARCDESVVVLV